MFWTLPEGVFIYTTACNAKIDLSWPEKEISCPCSRGSDDTVPEGSDDTVPGGSAVPVPEGSDDTVPKPTLNLYFPRSISDKGLDTASFCKESLHKFILVA